jgi:hypothetical protein
MLKLFLSFLSIIISIFLIYSTFLNFKIKNISKIEFYLWSCIWLLLIFISLRPNFFDLFFIKYTKISIFYAVNIVSFIFLFYLNFKYFIKIKILEKKIDTLIRSEALSKIYNKLKK